MIFRYRVMCELKMVITSDNMTLWIFLQWNNKGFHKYDYTLLQCIFIIINLGLNISWENLRSQIYSKMIYSFHKKTLRYTIKLTFCLQSNTATDTVFR